MPKHNSEPLDAGRAIGQHHIRWYKADRQLLKAIRETAKASERNVSQQIKFLLRQAIDRDLDFHEVGEDGN